MMTWCVHNESSRLLTIPVLIVHVITAELILYYKSICSAKSNSCFYEVILSCIKNLIYRKLVDTECVQMNRNVFLPDFT